MARAHAALAAEQAYPGHDALGLGVEFTFDEVRDCLPRLKNHKAAGIDGILAELLKYSGGTGFRCSRTCLTLLLPPDAYPPRGVREWLCTDLKGATQGTVLTTDPLRSFRLSTSCLPSSSRNAPHVLCACTTSSMHFAPAEEGSTLCRTCWQLCGGAPRLTRPRMPVFSMPQKHTTRYRTLCCSIASFSAALWVQCSPSWWHCTRRRPAACVLGRPPAFAVQRAVAQGCPLSPLLYAIFIDPVLQDMQSLPHPDMLWLGPPTSKRKLVGQAYADDLAGIAATQQGLQRVVDAVHAHSLRWGWLLNVHKSVVIVFGKRSVCARLGAPELSWGMCLPTVCPPRTL